MRHGLRPGAGSGSPDDCLVPTYPESSPNYYDTTTENLRHYFSYFSATTKSNKTRSFHNKTPPHHHAAMTRRSSLRAAVEPIPAVGRHRSVNNRTGLADTGSGDHLVTHAQRENIVKLIFLAQSDDTDQLLPGLDTPSSRHFHPLNGQLTFRKKMDHCCRKDNRIPEFSGVISTTRAPPTRAEVVHGLPPHRNSPQSRADSPPLTKRPYRHPHPYPGAPTRAASARHKALHARAPTPPTTISAAPNPADLPSITANSRAQPVSPVHDQSQPPCSQRSCTVAQYSNAADQHHPTTPTTDQRPAETTPIDRPARSSGEETVGSNPASPTL